MNRRRRKNRTQKVFLLSMGIASAMTLAMWGCAPGAPTAAMDDDAPDFIDPLPSPTPTWARPDPDDEDPIADCALDAPLCVIDVGLVGVAGEVYLGVELQMLPVPDKFQPDGAEHVLLDANVAVQRDGATVAEIDVEGFTVAVAPSGGNIILTQGDGEPLLSIDSSELGVLLSDPRSSPSLSAAYDPSTEDLLLLDAEGNPVATSSVGGVGVLLADPRPSPIYHISEDPTSGGYLILNAEEEPLVMVDASNATIWFLDSGGDRTVGLIMLDGLVVIAAPGIGPVAAIDPKGDPAAAMDPKIDDLRITMLLPAKGVNEGNYELVGSISLYGQTADGKRVAYGGGPLGLKDVAVVEHRSSGSKEPVPSPTTAAPKPTWTPAAPKPTWTPAAPKPTWTPAAPKPTWTSAAPKPAATSSGGKATSTPGK